MIKQLFCFSMLMTGWLVSYSQHDLIPTKDPKTAHVVKTGNEKSNTSISGQNASQGPTSNDPKSARFNTPPATQPVPVTGYISERRYVRIDSTK